jgi:hypothetical protein
MKGVDAAYLRELHGELDTVMRERLDSVIDRMVRTKEGGGKIVVVTGSGPNIHEGATTLLAELIANGVIDGIITSSAVVAHEMAGSLDRVKRVDGRAIGIEGEVLPRGDLFEVTMMEKDTLALIQEEMIIDTGLIEKVLNMSGEVIIKAAGNMAYPMGLRTERLAGEVEGLARVTGETFEYIAGLGADPRTMIGAGARMHVPVVVSVPQLIGGGMVGLSIGDSISFKRRSALVASMLAEASIIIESGIALSQEIHDGPFETYTGHGIWSAWEGMRTFSLRDKTLVRIDLDPNLEKVWEIEKSEGVVQKSVDRGLPKTKTFKVPFRMEMSGFARLEGSIPLIGDLGVLWPLLAEGVSEKLRINLDFVSYPQESERGKEMRNWIVDNVHILDRRMMFQKTHALMSASKPLHEGGA